MLNLKQKHSTSPEVGYRLWSYSIFIFDIRSFKIFKICFILFLGHGSSSEDKDREAVKAAILAQYGSSVVEDDASDEDPDDCDDDGNDLMAKNTNSEAVAKAQNDQREKSKAAAHAKKEKDKEDREKQKKDQEERKKKAQEKAAKGERRR